MYNNIIELITENLTYDKYGNKIITKTAKEVFCKIKSIGTNEFYSAGTTALKPEIKFILADYYDYNNEKKINYQDVEYNVIRTYRNGNELEITCERVVVNA